MFENISGTWIRTHRRSFRKRHLDGLVTGFDFRQRSQLGGGGTVLVHSQLDGRWRDVVLMERRSPAI